MLLCRPCLPALLLTLHMLQLLPDDNRATNIESCHRKTVGNILQTNQDQIPARPTNHQAIQPNNQTTIKYMIAHHSRLEVMGHSILTA